MSGSSPMVQPALLIDFVRSSSEEEPNDVSGAVIVRNPSVLGRTPPCIKYQEILSPVYSLYPAVDLTGDHLSHVFMDSLNQRVLKFITRTQVN